MPDQVVQFEGVEHHFPDDFSQAEVAKALARAHPLPAQPQASPDKGYFEQTALFHPKEAAQGLLDTATHPLAALQGWLAQNGQLGQSALDSFKAGNYADGLRHTASYLANMVPGVGQKLDQAGNKAGAGNLEGGMTDAASLATDLLAGAKAPAVLDTVTNPGALTAPARVAGAAIKAGGPDVAAGAAKTAGGWAIAEGVKSLGVPGQLMTDMSFAYPLVKNGVRQVGRGLKSGYAAGSDVVATRPLDTSLPGTPAASALQMPEGVDPAVWAKIPPQMQEALVRKAATPASTPVAPRPPEYYGVQSQTNPSPVERAVPTAPAPTGPAQNPVYALPQQPLYGRGQQPSQAIQSIAYHPESQTALAVLKGRQYEFPLTPEQHGRLLAASADPNSSVGDVWNKEIRPGLETASGKLRPKATTPTPADLWQDALQRAVDAAKGPQP